VITTGFLVTFDDQNVAKALSVTLNRCATLPKVVLYDVACELDCYGMQCVRALFFYHEVHLCLHKNHAKGEILLLRLLPGRVAGDRHRGLHSSCRGAYFRVSEVTGHLADISPTVRMAKRIYQLSTMNLTVSFQIYRLATKTKTKGTLIASITAAASSSATTRLASTHLAHLWL